VETADNFIILRTENLTKTYGSGTEEVGLEKACAERAALLVALKVDTRFDPLRFDPRLQDLLHRMNFPPQTLAAASELLAKNTLEQTEVLNSWIVGYSETTPAPFGSSSKNCGLLTVESAYRRSELAVPLLIRDVSRAGFAASAVV
jgi:hypothetical protein